MPDIGLCCGLADASRAADAGFDYIEAPVASYLLDAGEAGRDRTLPVRACYLFVPSHLPIVGPARDRNALNAFVGRVIGSARDAGVAAIVFGSGGARRRPEGVTPEDVDAHLRDFLTLCADAAAGTEVVVVIEPLNRGDCNTINTVAEAADLVRRVGSPNIKALVDTYHSWQDAEPPADVARHADVIRHIHVADLDGRRTPGRGDTPNPVSYADFFRPLKAAGYAGRVSIEGNWQRDADVLADSVTLLRDAWDAA